MQTSKDKEFLEKVKNNLSIEQIESIIAELGGEPQRDKNIIKSKTICHCGNSHKLWYYDNTKLFKCFTDCGETFDIFDLVFKVNYQLDNKYVFPKAVDYVAKYFGIKKEQNAFEVQQENLIDWQILKKYEYNNNLEYEEQLIEPIVYNKDVLKFLPHPHILQWEEEGITREIMELRDICYNPVSQGIVIPHYDIDNNLIGIRERTLIKENEKNGKYRPAIINGKMYNHSLGFNLYNLNNSKDNIKKIKKAIVFEGEKSCLLYASYFGVDNDISVACCGSSLINYQVELLLNLGVDEIIVAFDKQFKNIDDEEWKNWTKKLYNIHTKYGSKAQMSYIFDLHNELEYKASPIDEGKEKFLKLFKERVRI